MLQQYTGITSRRTFYPRHPLRARTDERLQVGLQEAMHFIPSFTQRIFIVTALVAQGPAVTHPSPCIRQGYVQLGGTSCPVLGPGPQRESRPSELLFSDIRPSVLEEKGGVCPKTMILHQCLHLRPRSHADPVCLCRCVRGRCRIGEGRLAVK